MEKWYFAAFLLTVIALFCHYFRSTIFLILRDSFQSQDTLEMIRLKREMNQEEISRYQEETRRIKISLEDMLLEKKKIPRDLVNRSQIKSLQNRENLRSVQKQSTVPVMSENTTDRIQPLEKKKIPRDLVNHSQTKFQNRENLRSVQKHSTMSVLSRRELIQLQDLEYEESVQMDLGKQNFAEKENQDPIEREVETPSAPSTRIMDKPEPEVCLCTVCIFFIHSYRLGWPRRHHLCFSAFRHKQFSYNSIKS
jgi:hypothetical protein